MPGFRRRNHAEVMGLVLRSEFELKGQPEVSRIVGNKIRFQ